MYGSEEFVPPESLGLVNFKTLFVYDAPVTQTSRSSHLTYSAPSEAVCACFGVAVDLGFEKFINFTFVSIIRGPYNKVYCVSFAWYMRILSSMRVPTVRTVGCRYGTIFFY